MLSPILGWRARNYSDFQGRTLKEGVQLRLGTLNPSGSVRIKLFTHLFAYASMCDTCVLMYVYIYLIHSLTVPRSTR